MLCCCTKLFKFCDVSKLHIVIANYLLALFYMNISYFDCPCIINMHIIFISLRRTCTKKQTHTQRHRHRQYRGRIYVPSPKTKRTLFPVHTHTTKNVPPSESVGLESHPLRHWILGINRVGGGAGQVFI